MEYSEEQINNYPILKELEPYTDNNVLCSTVSEKKV